ncbi:hypothetical protein [Dactylosporangium sp. CA-092794]|uniref:hypothetical protein n=1 Tax=Dactylosporangium sp. CA-092794 TaxID=3239929 RepID=UPI003D9441E5
MAALTIAPIVPPSALAAAGPEGPRGLPRRPLPLAPVPSPHTSPMRYGLATLDNRGRVADGALVRAMGWAPGTRVHIREQSGLVLVTADAQGVFSISRQGYVQLPATVRHWCRLTIGERLLLSADPARKLLVVHPPEALDAMVAHLHALRIGQDES